MKWILVVVLVLLGITACLFTNDAIAEARTKAIMKSWHARLETAIATKETYQQFRAQTSRAGIISDPSPASNGKVYIVDNTAPNGVFSTHKVVVLVRTVKGGRIVGGEVDDQPLAL